MAVHSDWGDWLPREIEDADPEGIAVWYLGCNGFVLKAADTTVFVDPYLGTGDPPRTVRMVPVPFDPADVTEADAVFATHEHTDHVHGPSQAPILENTDATFYGPDDSVAVAREEENWTDEWDVSDDRLDVVEEGDSVEVGAFTVHVEPAHDPDATHPVSYLFEYNGRTVFHGGDTKPSDEFARIGEEYDIDLGILAFGTVGNIPDKETDEPTRTKWYNDENQAVEAASDLQFERFLPSHWDMWKGLTADPKALHHHVNSFDYPRELEIVEIGDKVDV
ncbi:MULTISPECIES: MBL fold metallo-hydrolase [Halorussus]|uniref:MBL fold metallo-hydrolase n=1 Tax=Halorussus TaxID=1070314 RepID=UPI0020A0760B|nr:MBL fold metallo-hydrolase [Halorussus vallis]USZ76100.1 MBL fold metallo-hydrolase [Halorussus vallis]